MTNPKNNDSGSLAAPEAVCHKITAPLPIYFPFMGVKLKKTSDLSEWSPAVSQLYTSDLLTLTFSIFWFNIIASPIFHFSLFVHSTHLKKSCGLSTSFPPSPCLKKINEPYLMYNAAGERPAKKTLTLLNENFTTENATVDLRGRVGIIIPKSAMDWETDVHLSVIYSTWPVQADKVNLACQPPSSLWIALLNTLWTQEAGMAWWHHMYPTETWPLKKYTPGTTQCLLHVSLGNEGLCLKVWVLKCIITRHKWRLIPALRRALAQPSGYLKCPAVCVLTYNSWARVSLPSHPSSLWTITE